MDILEILEQAKAFDQILDEKGWKLNAVINKLQAI